MLRIATTKNSSLKLKAMTMDLHPYETDLGKNAANHVPLSPLSYLERAAYVYPGRPAVVHGSICRTWGESFSRCRRLASALRRAGIRRGDTVAAMLPNVPAMLEAHFGVPAAGAVLNTLNTRLDSAAIAFMLRHGDAKALLVDAEFATIVSKALELLGDERPVVIDVADDMAPGPRIGDVEYEAFLATGDGAGPWTLPTDEWNAIALNYTSGTTGNPKGVVTHHRGAYLNAASNVIAWNLPRHARYLWTLPMFHCNGWCFPWTLALVAGVSVCLRKVDPALIYSLIRQHAVSHMCGAPIVYATMINAPATLREGVPHKLHGMIAGAAPPMAVIEGCERAGIELTHVYGLTEVYGPAAICAPQSAWDALAPAERAERIGRQGVPYPLQQAVTVLDTKTMQPVPADGATIGEVCFRGNAVMKGYLKNREATHEAFEGGWFHTGDLAVIHPDGYVKVKDRGKDIIISGGENISSIEVEDALHGHPAVLLAAVVALPDARWGEVPCAFVELKPGAQVAEAELIEFCRDRLARFKLPKRVVFGELPRTSTGKVQKFVLREHAKSASAIE